MKKSNFYSVFNNIFHSKCKTVYTFEVFFRATFVHGVPQKVNYRYGTMENNSIWTPLKKWIQENYATRKDQVNYGAGHSSESGGRPPPSDP